MRATCSAAAGATLRFLLGNAVTARLLHDASLAHPASPAQREIATMPDVDEVLAELLS